VSHRLISAPRPDFRYNRECRCESRFNSNYEFSDILPLSLFLAGLLFLHATTTSLYLLTTASPFHLELTLFVHLHRTAVLSYQFSTVLNMAPPAKSIYLSRWPSLDVMMSNAVLQARNNLTPDEISHVALIFLAALEKHVDEDDFLYEGRYLTDTIKQEYLKESFGEELDRECILNEGSIFLMLAPGDIGLPVDFIWAWRRLMRRGLKTDLRQYRPAINRMSEEKATWPKTQAVLERMNQSAIDSLKLPIDCAIHKVVATVFRSLATLPSADMSQVVLDFLKSALGEAGRSHLPDVQVRNMTMTILRQERASERQQIDNEGDSSGNYLSVTGNQQEATAAKDDGKLPLPLAQAPTIISSMEEDARARTSRKRALSERSLDEDSNDSVPVAPPRRRLRQGLPFRAAMEPNRSNVAIDQSPDRQAASVTVSSVIRRTGRILERYEDDREELVASIGRYRVELQRLEERRERSPT
jgi:hypothetical protein